MSKLQLCVKSSTFFEILMKVPFKAASSYISALDNPRFPGGCQKHICREASVESQHDARSDNDLVFQFYLSEYVFMYIFCRWQGMRDY